MRNGFHTNEYGSKCWYLNDQLHRDGVPAVENAGGDKFWYQHGKLHREDGPAVVSNSGYQYWWYQGKYITCNSQEEFERLLNLKALW